MDKETDETSRTEPMETGESHPRESGTGEVGDAKDWKEAFRRAVEAKDLGEKFESQNQKPGVKFHRKRLVRKVGKGTQERKFVIKVSHHPNKEDLRLRELETFDGLINSGNIITHHGHIVRKNERSTTVYLWLENWKCNLEEARGKLEDGSLHPLVVLRDVTTGLVNLSKNYTVHRDIRPQSVLICGDSKGLLCAKIGEFDLAKQKSEKGYSKHSGSGTDDWKAPDKRVTENYDIFGTGLLFNYVLIGGYEEKLYKSAVGLPPKDGLCFEKLDDKIKDYQDKADAVVGKSVDEFVFVHYGAFRRLIQKMLDRDDKKRPSAQEVQQHCAFWTLEKARDYLLNLRVKIREKEKGIDRSAVDKMYKVSWETQLHADLQKNIKNGKFKYDLTRMSEAIVFIMDKYTHFKDEKNEGIQKFFGTREHLVLYFLRRFPYLLFDAWNVLN